MASSSSSALIRNYDVFLSFRGEDTRDNIVSHLFEALDLRGIFTFIDTERIEAGDKISDRLTEAIKTSWFAVVVISEKYATSKWCLEELRLIMELHGDNRIQVVPMFYRVNPSDVRHQRGSFEDAFKSYEREQPPDMRIAEWRGALTQLADLAGLHSTTCLHEAAMIGTIVRKITNELQAMKPEGLINLVGMEAHMKTMEGLLRMESEDEVRMIGVWGMGGIGKTTIAKCFYAQFSSQFPAYCFIENIQNVYLKEGPSYLKEKFLFSILSGAAGFQEIKARLGNQKVLVVLDGVDDAKQVHTLAKEINWLRPGSRIIITTQDKGLLHSCGVSILHEVKCLDDKDSLQVFTKLAFGGDQPPNGVEKHFLEASRLAHGLPSALVDYASYLSSEQTPEEWKGALRLFKTSPHKNVQKILRNTYDDLWEPEQTAFLIVACLFNGYPFGHVTSLLDNGRPRIDHLVGKSLISISMNGCLNMHGLVVQTGRQIVRQESKGRPPRQKFIWDADDIYDVLERGIGTDKIEGMTLHMCEKPDILPMSNGVFRYMHNLKFLKFFQPLGNREANLQLNSDPLDFPCNLWLLHWDAYPLRKWPSNLRPNHLVELNLRYSNLESLWDWTVDLRNLLRLDVTGSRNLRGLPDLSTAKKLEELVIEGCTRLDRIPESIMILTKLKKLNAIDCHILRGINFTVDFSGDDDIHQAIEWRLIFPSLKGPLILSNNISIEGQIDIKSYHLNGNAEHISYSFKQEIPETSEKRRYGIRCMKSLHIKRFSYRNPHIKRFRCYSFQLFPSLTELNLTNLNISTIPDDINHSPLLRKIDLSGNDFVRLPTTMQSLANLKYLSLRNCPKLTSLPQLTQVETLILSDCENLQTLLRLRANEEHGTNCLLELWLDNCRSAQKLSDELTRFTKLTYLDLSRHDFVTVPSSIRELSSLGTLFFNNCKKLKSIEELPLSIQYLYAQGCDSLENVSLSSDHSIKHIDLKDCPRMKQDEQLKTLFSNDGHVQEVSPRFSTLSRTGEASHFDNEPTGTTSMRISQPSIWTALTGNCFQFLESFFGRH